MKQGNRCECLDFVEASHRHRIYPVMYCRMEITGHLDMERFKAALQTACRYVQKSFAAYRGGFDLWDLSSGPQLRINVRRQGT